ncbi:MAG: carboxylating nicotinate-nucleotide diphosphorylase [Deltaproteobacteria bacterium]|nr:MAG: carboxylating nicotinate-nucleotide diphosphorylase [Deltaproteobacteria bacterium]
MDKYPSDVERMIRLALEEDLGPGDVTTDAVISGDVQGRASLFSREEVVLAGLAVFQDVFRVLDPEVAFELCFGEGDRIPAGGCVCSLRGRLRSILKGERTALNFLQRMSGIATLTREYVDRAGTGEVKILDTRKTTPGLRWLEKYAVRVGGGTNHRFGLFDGILIKDNHIAAAGSIRAAVDLAGKNAPHGLKIEVEVENLAGVAEALSAGADVILLDNMSVDEMHKAVELVGGRALLEASGGVTLDTVGPIAQTGVDMISVGALTHSARAVDLSLEIVSDVSADA